MSAAEWPARAAGHWQNNRLIREKRVCETVLPSGRLDGRLASPSLQMCLCAKWRRADRKRPGALGVTRAGPADLAPVCAERALAAARQVARRLGRERERGRGHKSALPPPPSGPSRGATEWGRAVVWRRAGKVVPGRPGLSCGLVGRGATGGLRMLGAHAQRAPTGRLCAAAAARLRWAGRHSAAQHSANRRLSALH